MRARCFACPFGANLFFVPTIDCHPRGTRVREFQGVMARAGLAYSDRKPPTINEASGDVLPSGGLPAIQSDSVAVI